MSIEYFISSIFCMGCFSSTFFFKQNSFLLSMTCDMKTVYICLLLFLTMLSEILICGGDLCFSLCLYYSVAYRVYMPTGLTSVTLPQNTSEYIHSCYQPDVKGSYIRKQKILHILLAIGQSTIQQTSLLHC